MSKYVFQLKISTISSVVCQEYSSCKAREYLEAFYHDPSHQRTPNDESELNLRDDSSLRRAAVPMTGVNMTKTTLITTVYGQVYVDNGNIIQTHLNLPVPWLVLTRLRLTCLPKDRSMDLRQSNAVRG